MKKKIELVKKNFIGTDCLDDEAYESEDGTEETELYHQLLLSVK